MSDKLVIRIMEDRLDGLERRLTDLESILAEHQRRQLAKEVEIVSRLLLLSEIVYEEVLERLGESVPALLEKARNRIVERMADLTGEGTNNE